MVGCTLEEITQKTMDDIFPNYQERRQRFSEWIRYLLSEQRPNRFQYMWLFGRHNQTIPVAVRRHNPVLKKKGSHSYVTLSFKNLLAAEGLITISSNCTVLLFNEDAEAIFGYGKDEILACNINVLMPEEVSSAETKIRLPQQKSFRSLHAMTSLFGITWKREMLLSSGIAVKYEPDIGMART